MSPTAAIFDVFETFGSLRKSIPFSIRTDPLLFSMISRIFQKVIRFVAMFCNYAWPGAWIFKNHPDLSQNYTISLLNLGINKKFLKIVIKINKMDQRGLDAGGVNIYICV